MNTVQVISILASVFLFAVVVDFVRRNLLKEKYSVLWIALSIVVIILSLWRGLLDRIAGMVGVSYAPSLLFLVAFIFVILILLHFSVVISILYDKNKVLTQELSLLKEKLEGDGKPGDGRGGKAVATGARPARRGSAGRGGRGNRGGGYRGKAAPKLGEADSGGATSPSSAKGRPPEPRQSPDRVAGRRAAGRRAAAKSRNKPSAGAAGKPSSRSANRSAGAAGSKKGRDA